MTEWFTPQQANLIGALAGSLIGGVGGGGTGALVGVLAPRGRARKLVLGIMIFWIVLGIAALATGAYAIIAGQPAHVWKPFILIGAILTLVMGGLYPVALLRYRQADQRRLQAEELRRG